MLKEVHICFYEFTKGFSLPVDRGLCVLQHLQLAGRSDSV
jgi:hypothetical protein